MGWLVAAFAAWLIGWQLNGYLARRPYTKAIGLAGPIVFGATVIVIWECLVHGLNISPILLPPPSQVAVTFANSLPLLWRDFAQTVLRTSALITATQADAA